MKKIIVSFSVLAVSAMFFYTGCKPKDSVAPAADKEFQSSVEISHALYAFLDAEQIVSFVGEQDQSPKFYMPAANSGTGDVTSIPPGQTGPEQPGIFSLGYRTPTGSNFCLCADGRKRNGTVGVQFSVNQASVNWPPLWGQDVTPNSIYFRRLHFGAYMSFSNYVVDDWFITNTNPNFEEDGQNITIKNNLTSSTYSIAASNLSWDIKGSFKVKKGNDSTLCRISMTKVLLSSNNPSVYPPPAPGGNNTDAPIKWGWINPSNPADGVKVGYYGTVSGFTSGHVPFTYEIKKEQMVVRDFACYPDKISGISVSGGTVTAQKEEFHPFVNGIASFTTGSLYPRQIYYGGSETSGEGQCDNSGAVLIKGISYPVDFLK